MKLTSIEKASEILGMCGRMVSPSKSFYSDNHPTHQVVFNSNVCIKGSKVWYGDLDLTLFSKKLQTLSDMLKEKVYVLYESDGRFENEEKPLLEKAVVTFEPGGER